MKIKEGKINYLISNEILTKEEFYDLILLKVLTDLGKIDFDKAKKLEYIKN